MIFMNDKKFGALSSSADPQKLAMSVKGFVVLAIGIGSLFGVDVSALDADGFTGAIVAVITTVTASVGAILTLWGLLRKIKLGKWN